MKKIGGKSITLCTMSDCTGAGSVERALASTARVLNHLGIADLTHTAKSASEAPATKHCHFYIEHNFNVEVMWEDMTRRTTDMVSGNTRSKAIFKRDPTTGDSYRVCTAEFCLKAFTLDIYSVGFECQDLSTRNASGIKLKLDNPPSYYLSESHSKSGGRSQATLMSSLVTVQKLQPRIVLIENVGGNHLIFHVYIIPRSRPWQYDLIDRYSIIEIELQWAGE